MDNPKLDSLKTKLQSRAWRLANLYWIEDEDGNAVKFKPNEVQRLLEGGLHNRNVILKSRQHGISTWACIRALDLCLFRKNTAAGIIAHTKLDALKFLRNKILFAYDRLPAWLREARPLIRKDMNGELVFGNDSRLVVDVSLRSGTYQWVHISELGPMHTRYPLRAKEVVKGTMNAVGPNGYVTIESTADGSSGPFYETCQRAMQMDRLVRGDAASLGKMDYKFWFLAWFEDPTNVLHEDVFVSPEMLDYFAEVEAETGTTLRPEQRAFYIKKAEEQAAAGEDSMWSEFPSTPAEAFKASVQGSYFGKLIDKAELQGRITNVPFIPGIPVNTFWDIGKNDTTAIWFHQQIGPWHHFIDYYETAGEGADHFALELQTRAQKCGYVYGKHYLPHDAEVSDWSQSGMKTRAQQLEDLNVKPLVVVDRIQDILDGIAMVRAVLPRCRFDRKKCGELKPGEKLGGLPALRSYRKEWNDRGQCWASTPLHDWASNGADAFRQFAQGYKPASNQPQTERPNERDRDRTRRGPDSTVPRWQRA